ncbi:hypothetical protein PR202_ga08612 [Eleusine coracana subsp. coracana]|uniref:Uncharacterized protein n=1 Tax=Eleusine coracana subsp. coracana TaxID=191504 RepID=A0AAV5C0P8_ELECO|nr:hypothetical protein PR202_ga08612 [Eleusine coracana subsp. coracana]
MDRAWTQPNRDPAGQREAEPPELKQRWTWSTIKIKLAMDGRSFDLRHSSGMEDDNSNLSPFLCKLIKEVSPIGYCHALLIPRIQDCLPQRIDQESFLLAMLVLDLQRKLPGILLGVQYPVEKAATEKLTTLSNGVSIALLMQYPCYAEKQLLGKASQEFLDMMINPAIWELSGHLILKRRKDYDEASEATICRFLVEASFPETEFQELKRRVMELLTSGVGCNSG